MIIKYLEYPTYLSTLLATRGANPLPQLLAGSFESVCVGQSVCVLQVASCSCHMPHAACHSCGSPACLQEFYNYAAGSSSESG